MSKRSYSRAVAFIEDVSVPPEHLAAFMREYRSFMKTIGKESGIYGHAGSGCMHIRPFMDMRKEEELHLMKQIMQQMTPLLLKYNGALSGEHGDGLIRSWLTKDLFGDQIYEAFIILKQAFDPDNRLNPGKIVFPSPFEKNLRMDSHTPIHQIETFLDFSKEGGLALAVDMCNGNAQCRNLKGRCVPPFKLPMMNTTRRGARAQALRAITTGRMSLEETEGRGLHNVLDLCIQCKGCKTECPSQVDMAKMKSEFLFQYQRKHGVRLRDRLFGFIGALNKVTSPFAKILNRGGSTALVKKILDYIGIAPQRDLPKLAPFRFSQWLKSHPSLQAKKTVVLLNDTFTEFNEPSVGIAAKFVIESLGYSVIVPQWRCCGRTLISKGFLPQAKQKAEHLIKMLIPFAKLKIPIIGIEPSCLLTIKDDFQGLLGYQHSDLKEVIPHCFTFDEFIASHVHHNALPISLHSHSQTIKFHGHCHQKALIGTSDSIKVLKCLPGSLVEEIPSGCCGMAGSFGYEKEHYDFSVKIAQLHLVPALRISPPNTIVVANGFSCRHQIRHLLPHQPQHLAELLYKSLQ